MTQNHNSFSSQAGLETGVERTWKTQTQLWEKLKPLSREMRPKPTIAENRLWQMLRNKQVKSYR
ncbi:MAG: hypothetical protein HC785_12195 [Calothrix sp. CSU_2_0]|nr:hypothetical protein [Calothrix sp. CSU_2_0]